MVLFRGFEQHLHVHCLLTIEKATFRSLSASRYWQRCLWGDGLLITAKGYPDMITRSFLHSLSGRRPDVPVFVLVDFDPHGLNIFHCFLHGSGNVLTDSAIRNGSMRFLGIKSRHLFSINVANPASLARVGAPAERQASTSPSGATAAMSAEHAQVTTSVLDTGDRKLICHTLNRLSPSHAADSTCATLVQELQVMQMLGYKAEIQALGDGGNLEKWLDAHIGEELHAL